MITLTLKRLIKIVFYGLKNSKNFFLSIKIAFLYLYYLIFINKFINQKYKREKKNFIKICNDDLNFDQRDLFSNNIPYWLYIFKKNSLINKKLLALEIGSYEGRSSYFLLKYLKNVKLTCVDTFKPFHELQNYNKKKFAQIYKNFKKNTLKYSNKLKVIKNSSKFFFSRNNKKFDLIYIDGSHKYEDILHDANHAFTYLNKNGIIIFDDFLWEGLLKNQKLPIHAIMRFLKDNQNKLEIVFINYQLMIKKI